MCVKREGSFIALDPHDLSPDSAVPPLPSLSSLFWFYGLEHHCSEPPLALFNQQNLQPQQSTISSIKVAILRYLPSIKQQTKSVTGRHFSQVSVENRTKLKEEFILDLDSSGGDNAPSECQHCSGSAMICQSCVCRLLCCPQWETTMNSALNLTSNLQSILRYFLTIGHVDQ